MKRKETPEQREARLEYLRNWRKSNPDYMKVWASQNKDHLAKYARDRRKQKIQNDPEWAKRESEMKRKWKLKNKDKSRKDISDWKRNNPNYAQQKKGRRRARILNAPVNDLKRSDWLDILEKSKNICAYCGNYFDKLTMDHVVPLSIGGSHTKSNIVAACHQCNSVKRDCIWEIRDDTPFALDQGTNNNHMP